MYYYGSLELPFLIVFDRQDRSSVRNGQDRSGTIRNNQEQSGTVRNDQERSGTVRNDQKQSGTIRNDHSFKICIFEVADHETSIFILI